MFYFNGFQKDFEVIKVDIQNDFHQSADLIVALSIIDNEEFLLLICDFEIHLQEFIEMTNFTSKTNFNQFPTFGIELKVLHCFDQKDVYESIDSHESRNQYF
jgi:hypothetical protein